MLFTSYTEAEEYVLELIRRWEEYRAQHGENKTAEELWDEINQARSELKRLAHEGYGEYRGI